MTLFFCVAALPLLAQGPVEADTLLTVPFDSTAVLADTTQKSSRKTELEGPISYQAQVIETLVDSQQMVLTGRAKIAYQDMTLEADRVVIDWEKNLMIAQGRLDSVWVHDFRTGDSTRVEKWVDTPKFVESGDLMTGERMIYNFKTRKGRVLRGRTTHEGGLYNGQVIKMTRAKTLCVGDGRFSTCDLDEPHFHFWSKEMKIEVNKKVVARPIVMYLGHIPVAALPFAYAPIRKGRHSGIIIPTYGQNTVEGNYLKGLGYYWAASKYWDVKGLVDYYERSGFLFRGDLRYNVRYKMRGRIAGSWTRKNFELDGSKERRWDLSVSHNQTFSPTMNLRVSALFSSSGNFYRNLSNNREMRMRQEINSNATFTKSFGGGKSITINLSQRRNLQTDEVTETLPQIGFRVGTFNLFKAPKSVKGVKAESKWYHNLRLSYNSNLKVERNKSLQADSTFKRTENMGWDHNLSFSSPFKISWFSFNPSIRYQETWYNKRWNWRWDDDAGFVQDEQAGFTALRTYSTAVSFGTKLYGMFQPKFLKNVMMRHVVTPSVSFNYQPDFTSARFDYYQQVEDSLGVIHDKDRYQSIVFRSTPRGERQALNFSVNNLFQMKTGSGENEKKFDLFNWSLSSGYNWKAERFKLGDISSNIRANPVKNLSMNFRRSYTPYETDSTGARVDRLLADDFDWSDLGTLFSTRWVRPTSTSFNLRYSLSGKLGGSKKEASPSSDQPPLSAPGAVAGDRFGNEKHQSSVEMPWKASIALFYSLNESNPNSKVKNFYTNLNLDFNLTPNWRITWRARYDFEDKHMVSQDFVFYRDLHCWEASFSWTPTGYNKRFYFKINVKSGMLRDLKLERRSGTRGLGTSAFSDYY